MEMDVSDAEQVEELAEIAGAFLADLGGERYLVIHGDEAHANPVTQVFSGLSYDAIESLIFEWSPVAEQADGVVLVERFGRHVMVAALRDSANDCLGMLYADRRKPFDMDAVESISKFARHYLNLLLEICTLRTGAWAPAHTHEEATPHPQENTVVPETDDSWIDESWADEEDLPDHSRELPDLQDYIMLDWYR